MNILAVSFFVFFPILSMPFLVFLSINQRFRENIPLLCVALALGLLSYAYIPDESKDIYRHYLLVRDLNIYGSELLVYLLQFIGGPALFYLIAYSAGTLDIFNLMPLVMVTMAYGFYLIGIKNVFENHHIHDKFVIFVAFAWVFSSLSYPFISTNLRQPLAVSLVFYFLQKRHMNMPLFSLLLLAASLLHVTGALMAACFFIAYFWMNKTYKDLFFSCLILFSALLILYFLDYNFLNFLGYNFGIEDKLSLYENAKDTDEYTFEVFWKFLLLSYLNACTFLLLFFQIRISNYWILVKNSLEVRFSIVFFGVSLLFFHNAIVFQRLTFYLPLFGVSILSVYLKRQNKSSVLFWLTMLLLLITICYGILFQWANFGGYNYWYGVFYRDVFSILFLSRNYFLNI